ncbi:BRCA1-A complex subunit RAP80 [Pelodiscus sinensis]|uniref:BRCA1-A complex subunit RAP80 n=1 Tax=Pelodiscus sinensis TaxID=13735 RepID=UPI003F6B3D1F
MRAQGSEAAAASLGVGSGLAERGGRGAAWGAAGPECGMLRRKKPAEGPDPKGPAGEEEEQRVPLHAKKKRSFVDAFIVISDSDGEEAQDESGLQKKRTKPQLGRAKFAAKGQLARMSEDEQFALALRMSEQEARQANCQEEEEEELVRKAIAASLNSCPPSEPPGRQSPPAEPGGDEPQGAVPPCPDCPPSESSAPSWGSPAGLAKRPLVVLTRLSQEVVESSLLCGLRVSPGTGEGRAPPLARSSSRETLPSPAEEEPLPLSPSLARVAPSAWQLTPRRLFPAPCGSPKASRLLTGPGSAACSPAALRQSRAVEPGALPRTCCGAGSPRGAPRTGPGEGQEARDTVHYYWGVPFCPKGVDPNQYTQVILCQLEVYQKSLKRAQRRLLHKKEFGDPVVPCPPAPEQREPEGANGVPSGTAEGDSAGRREPEGAAWLLPTRAREPEQTPGQPLEAEKSSMSEDEPTTSYCQASQGLCAEDLAEDGEPMQITQSISALTPLGSKRSPDIGTGSPAAEEITVCPETQPSPAAAIEPERGDAPPQAAGEEEAGGTVPGGAVSCPLCERGFPAAEIELHAMYCDGHAAQGADGAVPGLPTCGLGLGACVCMCACVGVRVRAWACECVRGRAWACECVRGRASACVGVRVRVCPCECV